MFAAWGTGAIALLCVLILTPAVGELSRRWKLYDPVGPLKIHDADISRLGGASIGIGLAAAIIFGMLATTHTVSIFWLLAFALIWFSGLVDDIRGLSPFLKLLAQVGAGLLLWAGGWRVPGHPSNFAGIVAACAIVVVFVNAFNFLDGSDGLAAGITAIIGAAFATAYGSSFTSGRIVAYGLVGASLGFLWSNFPPAKIFMGDSGSTVLGLCVAFVSVDFAGRSATQPDFGRWLFPVLVVALPLVDGMVVVLRRLMRGASVLQGDRFHFYDQMLNWGWSPRSVAGVSYAITSLLAATGLWMIDASLLAVGIFGVLTAVGLAVGILNRLADGGAIPRAIRERAET
ncbi:MAG TPA: MraY family glycosyltransferase [Candidatus Acidoferrales bacterium]